MTKNKIFYGFHNLNSYTDFKQNRYVSVLATTEKGEEVITIDPSQELLDLLHDAARLTAKEAGYELVNLVKEYKKEGE